MYFLWVRESTKETTLGAFMRDQAAFFGTFLGSKKVHVPFSRHQQPHTIRIIRTAPLRSLFQQNFLLSSRCFRPAQ